MGRSFLNVALALLVFVAGCSPKVVYVPTETIKEVHIRDSVYLRDTLVRIELEKARLSDFVNLDDTLVLSTDLARSVAFIDTTAGKLKGTIENIKPYVEGNVQIKEKIVYRDSLVYQGRPYPVEVEKKVPYVPWYHRVLSVIGIFALAFVTFKLIWKFKK